MTDTHLNTINGHGDEQPAWPSALSAVDVSVEAYLGNASMTVAALKALQTGGVVTLESALNAFVELRVNGVAIAEGELVAVGDQFGVRIVRLAP
jgi:flagellar motor switch protein FliN